MYILHCLDHEGREVRLRYSPHDSTLTDEDGQPLLTDTITQGHSDALAISPHAPGRKTAGPKTLKIQLGMRCNYSCSYCNQASEAGAGLVTKTADADEFLAGLDAWLQGVPERIEFWGGEPFLYFAKLQKLVPQLRRRFPDAAFSIVSNGSLLDEEIIDFIERHDIFVAISHDGPGHHHRGPDPFEDPKQARWLREFWRRRGGARHRAAFNFVLTPANADVVATRRWLAERVGDNSLLVDTEGIVTVYDDRTAGGVGHWTAEDYKRLSDNLREGFTNGEALKIRDIAHRAQDFIESLRTRRPSSSLGQKCGMDREDSLAVDLKGNVMTCQNTGAQGRHRIGDVTDMAGVRLDTATHWSHRESCKHCPVLQLCKGSCMFLHDELFAQSCENEYQFNLGILGGVLEHVAGLSLQSVSGDIRRPKAPRVFKLTRE
ncbi:hypothetical protein GCM10027034_16350 [Ramlibacter solisilvae]|uniref:radical SAM/SPASM domain-containing protein n=1 Tax=Ramlibacter tataouinensis TaxID=94132 RepID=UPI000777A1BD|nr:radical SAM protein [Ramlibacter tataouinensis]